METEFKLETSIGQKVIMIKINIPNPEDEKTASGFRKEGVFTTSLKIVFQTLSKIALNDTYITRLDRLNKDERKENYKSCLEYPEVSISTRDTIFPNGIFGTIYTIGSEKRAKTKLIKAMQTKLDKELGFFSRINISDFVKSKS